MSNEATHSKCALWSLQYYDKKPFCDCAGIAGLSWSGFLLNVRNSLNHLYFRILYEVVVHKNYLEMSEILRVMDIKSCLLKLGFSLMCFRSRIILTNNFLIFDFNLRTFLK